MYDTFAKIAKQVKESESYKKKEMRYALSRAENDKNFHALLDIVEICDVKISLFDLFAMSKETAEDFSTEDAQAEFIFEHFHEMGIECNFTDFHYLTKEQFALCMHLATIHYCNENL